MTLFFIMPIKKDILRAGRDAAKKAEELSAEAKAAEELSAEAKAKALVEENKTWAASKNHRVSTSIGLLKVTNHMRAPWVVPAEILPGKTKSDVSKTEARHSYFKYQQKIIMPNGTVVVDGYAFNRYYKASRAFQAMIDLKHLVVADITLPEAMLTSIAPATPPPDLTKQPTVAMHVEGDTGSIMDKMPNVTVLNR